MHNARVDALILVNDSHGLSLLEAYGIDLASVLAVSVGNPDAAPCAARRRSPDIERGSVFCLHMCTEGDAEGAKALTRHRPGTPQSVAVLAQLYVTGNSDLAWQARMPVPLGIPQVETQPRCPAMARDEPAGRRQDQRIRAADRRVGFGPQKPGPMLKLRGAPRDADRVGNEGSGP